MALAFLNIGTQEMILILIVVLLLFGGKKLPELARGLGRGIRDFKDASEGIKREISDQINSFEKDIDVKVDEHKHTSSEITTKDVVDSIETGIENNQEKNIPSFTPPENTYQHNPGGHPADGTDYYKYGYSDHFAEEEEPERKEEIASVEINVEDKKTDIKQA